MSESLVDRLAKHNEELHKERDALKAEVGRLTEALTKADAALTIATMVDPGQVMIKEALRATSAALASDKGEG